VETLQLHPDDNVAMAVTDLPAAHLVPAEEGGGPVLLPGPIPSGHKYARRAIPAGAPVLKYGQPIGRALTSIAPGEHVHVHNVESLRGRGDLERELIEPHPDVGPQPSPGPQPTPTGPPASAVFQGYRRRDGRAGVRNHLLVLAAVGCADGVVKRIGRALPEAIAVAHVYGCSQLGEDLAQTQRVLEGFAAHPNVGAVLLVGLGCETIATAEMAQRLISRGVVCQRLTIQEEGGSRATFDRGVDIARELLSEVSRARREPVPLSELILAVECGGSDAWSGVTANPATGIASDLLVQAGGAVILSEVTEFIGAEHLLAARSASAEIGRQIVGATLRREGEAKRLGVDMRGGQPTPGNIAGGLTTIEEKSLGAIAKGGSTTVREFVGYAHRPSIHGLVVMDTPGNDPESVTGMVAAGAQVVVFTTGRGSPTGCPIAPVIKVCSNSATYRRLAEDMDLDAGTIVEGGETPADVGRRIFGEIVAVASGKQTAAEAWGHEEFAIETIGPRL
jgi:altronate dehydratase large subunit